MTSGSSASSPTSEPSLDGALDRLEQFLREQHASYVDGLRTEGLAPLETALVDVLDAHERARSSVCTDERQSREALWRGVRQYRQTTMETVWQPVRTQLSRLDLGVLLRDGGWDIREARDDLQGQVPETITRPEPDGLYASSETDGWVTTTGKILARGWRISRRLVGSGSTPSQTIPLSSLVARLASHALAEAEEEALDMVEQRLVKWVATVEREAVAWTHRLLEIERVLDRPAFHASEEDVRDRIRIEDPTVGVMAADVNALRAEVQARVQSLHQTLEEGRRLECEDVEEVLAKARTETLGRIRSAADRSGTFIGEWESTTLSRSRGSSHRRRENRLDQWPDWFDEVAHRLAFLDALSTFRDDFTEQYATLMADVIQAGLVPARSPGCETANQLEVIREELDALLEPPDEGEHTTLVEAFSQQIERANHVLDDVLRTPLRESTPRRATETVLASHREAVVALLDAQPEGFVVHPLVAPDTSTITPGDGYTLQWRDGCREVFDEVVFDAWETALAPLAVAAEAEKERAEEVRAIVQFNLGAALQDLEDLRDAPRHDAGDASFLDNARELALGGLDRALDVLKAQDEALSVAGNTVLDRTWRAATEAWTDFHDRVRAAGQTRAHVLRLQGQLVRGARWLGLQGGRTVRAATTHLRRVLHRVQRQAQRLVHLGHAAVGTQPADEAALRHTVDTLSTVDDVLADLPLVYRRLFSFRPIHNEEFLIAREADRAVVDRHTQRWKNGLTNGLVLTGPAGSGRTSLLNVLRQTTFATARRSTIELTERITSEAAFARHVVRALGLFLEGDDTPTLGALAKHLQNQPVSDRLRVCFIEHFEHVFHRTVGGTELGARILEFLSETDTRVLWIATSTDAAWQFVEASEPTAARLVDRHRLEPFDRAELEELIMTRHRRSGLGLVFEIPDESTHPILARRASALDDEERRQALLRSEFFDHLYDVCGQNVMLALFYWFRSVVLDADEATLRVRPLSPVPFDVLDTLPLLHAFALKALLEHGTLTVEELADVIGVTPRTSRSLLETLGNALVIVPAEQVGGPGIFQLASVEYEARYRIRPLLIHPVTRFLRSRNIVH